MKSLFSSKSEPERPNATSSLWYPEAKICDKKMKSRGQYPKKWPMGAVIHYTAGRYENGLQDALSTQAWGVEQGYSFFVISSSGEILQSAPLDSWGYHAGQSSYPGLGDSVSSKLVGIEVCSPGRVEKVKGGYKPWFNAIYPKTDVRDVSEWSGVESGSYVKFTELQEQALVDLILYLKRGNPDVFSLDYVLGHYEVSPSRKADPGGSLSMPMSVFRELLKGNLEASKKEN